MKIQTTRIYAEIDNALKQGFSVVSEQGSSRSSKTYNTMIWIVCYCMRVPNTTVSVCRATLPALKSSVFRDFIEILSNMGEYSDKAMNKQEMMYQFSNGSWIEFFSCDSEQKLRGRKRQILYCNEANELRLAEWTQLQLRTTMFTIIDYNPSFSDEHWINTVNKEPNTHHFITTYKDNPFLEQKVIDEIESLQYKNKSLWQIYGLGLQAQVEGLIFPAVEIVETIPVNLKHYIGMDLGFTNDPTAIVEVFWDGKDNIYINELCYRTEMLTSDIIRELKAYGQTKVISESADPRLVQEVYRAGVNIHPVVKFKGSIEAGISKMKELKVHITSKSANVLKEFKNYTYQQDKEGKWLNAPIDCYNHAIDAIRYVVLMEILGGQPRRIDAKKIERIAYF